jgi:type IV secretion system protein VirD4
MIKGVSFVLLGAMTGAIVGLMAGGLVLNLNLGRDANAGAVFVLLTEFPGFARAWSPPWKLPYQIVLAASVLFALFVAAMSFQQKLTEYGQAKFQSRADMKRNGLLMPLRSGLVFGKLGSPKSKKPFISAAFTKFPHCLVVAPTRAGKGVGYVIPNTLLFAGSAVILDVKGEIFEATSRHRQSIGDEIFRFAPFDFDNSTHRYNPLERVAKIENLERRYTELSKIADYFLTVSDKGSAGDFLTEGRDLFVAAGLLAIERGKPTLGEISRLLFGKGATGAQYAILADEVHPSAKQTFNKFAGYDNKILSSHASVLGGAGMTLWNNPAVDRATSGNDFSFSDLRRKPQSIYLVVNADDIKTLAPLVRLFFGELIATLRSTMPDPHLEPWPVKILLDEFDQLGPMPIVEQALKQLAGHGARVSIITQSIPGLDNIYGENIRMSLESAAGMKLYLSANDKKTANEVSEASGKTTRLSISDSLSRDNSGVMKRSISRRMEERPLLSPDEVRKLSPSLALLIPERQNPLLVKRIIYFEDPTFLALFKAQKGPLPYPSKDLVKIADFEFRLAALESQAKPVVTMAYRDDAPVEVKPSAVAQIAAAESEVAISKGVVMDEDNAVDAVAEEPVQEDASALMILKPAALEAASKLGGFMGGFESKTDDKPM